MKKNKITKESAGGGLSFGFPKNLSFPSAPCLKKEDEK